MKQLKIGGYVRVSTEEQAALVDGSLDNQKYRINAYVDLKNLQDPNWGKVVEFYIDDGYSAKDTRRPAFQKMMSDLRKGKIDHILIADLSRLSRNISDFSEILEMLKENEASFLSIKEQFDTSTPAGKMMLFNMINLAQFEREQTAERVALGCHSRAMRGLLNGGHEILGYDKVPEKKNTYLINEEEAEKVRLIFKTFLQECSLNRTAQKLKDLGINPKVKKNRKEKIIEKGLWTHQTLGSFLRNAAYIGMREVNRKYKNSDVRFLKSYQKYQMVKATWPAIVDLKTFEAVQNLLTENLANERRRLSKSERRVFIASGIIHCKECGRAMVGSSSHSDGVVHRYYIHTVSKGEVITCPVKRIRADEIEEAISNHFSNIVLNGNYLDSVAERILNQSNESNSSLKTIKGNLQKELKKTLNEMEQAFKLHLQASNGTETSKFLFDKIEALGKRKNLLEESLNGMVDNEKSSIISLAEVRLDVESRIERATKGWVKLPAIQKKRALRKFVQKMLISQNGLDIYYYSDAMPEERSLGALSNETKSVAKVLPFGDRETGLGSKKSGSKQWVQNCVFARMVIPEGFEPSTYCLEGNCSIQLSYGTNLIKSEWTITKIT